MGLLSGKTALVMGVANRWSIATHIAKALHAHGARLALTYEGERTKDEVEKLARELGGALALKCDVSDDDSLSSMRAVVESEYKRLDAVVHSIAFARKEELAGKYHATSRSGFNLALDISAYSLVALCRELSPIVPAGGSFMAMTYLGSVRAVQSYNVMGVAKAALEASVRYLAVDLGENGIRVNAISAGPIKTASARAVSGFTSILGEVAQRSPLKRNVSAEDVGNVAVFLSSDLSSAVTGQVIYVDAGYSIVGI
ncbi:MAG TPA: enoyl-ACP reductase [Candidatus Eremiobacteraceae bacterium]|nr:enoyl-ACP reductase [Candidatus Eremiobacteraceae bacterium]